MATVSYAHVAIAKLRGWGPIAVRIGMREEFVAAVAEMDQRLQADPEAWGDPVRDYQGLSLTQYFRYGQLLIVDYAVHIDGTPVFVLDVHLRPGTALEVAAR
jgi:hypothetical protein